MAEFASRSKDHNGLVIIEAVGDIDLAVADRFWHEVSPWITPGARVVLDCSAVTFCDSMGVQVLIRAHKSARSVQAAFAVVAPSEPVTRVLELAGLTKIFRILDSPNELTAFDGAELIVSESAPCDMA